MVRFQFRCLWLDRRCWKRNSKSVKRHPVITRCEKYELWYQKIEQVLVASWQKQRTQWLFTASYQQCVKKITNTNIFYAWNIKDRQEMIVNYKKRQQQIHVGCVKGWNNMFTFNFFTLLNGKQKKKWKNADLFFLKDEIIALNWNLYVYN